MDFDDFLKQSRRQAERATPLVRAAARLRLARIEAAADPASARITLEMAVEEIGTLPESERAAMFDHARVFAAAIAPSLIAQLPEQFVRRSGASGWLLGKTMLEHGHRAAAYDFVLQDRATATFPFLFAMNLLHECTDSAQRVAVMRKAFAAWSETREREFLNLLGAYWTVLPENEARSMLHAVVDATVGAPEWPMQGSFDDGKLLFTSGREFLLFEVLHVLRRLDPPLANELIATHEQLAQGAQRYSNGKDSIQQEAEEEQRRREQEEGSDSGCGIVSSGTSPEMEFAFALQRGDLDHAMSLAENVYREDTDPQSPNFAPKVLWPSAAKFRSLLFHAGSRPVSEGRELLKQIADEDLRLLAEIEFVAAVAGLPEMPNSNMRQNMRQPGGHRGKMHRIPEPSGPEMVVDGVVVRCPGCQWRPMTGSLWPCRCGHVWNTFTTRGKCPACSYQWDVTQCVLCWKVSPHEEWYAANES